MIHSTVGSLLKIAVLSHVFVEINLILVQGSCTVHFYLKWNWLAKQRHSKVSTHTSKVLFVVAQSTQIFFRQNPN